MRDRKLPPAWAPDVMTEPSDADLVERFQRGDRLAFTDLVRRWEGFLLRIATRITGDINEAEEVRQTVFLRLLESPEAVRCPERFDVWLRRTAINEAFTSVRRRARRARAIDRLRGLAPVLAASPPGDALAAADDTARLSAALAQLEPEGRALLALRFDEGLTFAEIAAALDVPASTVKSRAGKLIARLRAMLDDDSNG